MAPIQTDRQVAILVILTLFAILSTLAVGARLVARRLKRLPLAVTDHCMIAAWVVNTFGHILCGYVSVIAGGLGNHQQNLTLEQTVLYLQLTFAVQLLWALSEGLLKCSMCFFYLMLFPQPLFRRWCYAVMGLCIAFLLSIVLAILLLCSSPSANWDGTELEHCGDTVMMWVVLNTLNIVSNFLVVFLPLPVLWRLSLPLKKKIGLCLIFFTGLLVSVISVIRIKVILEITRTDLSYEIGEANLWPMLEQSLGIILGCIPTLGPILRKFMGKPLDSSKDGQAYRGYSRSRTHRTFELLSNQDIALTTITAHPDHKDLSTTTKGEADDASSAEHSPKDGIKVVQQWGIKTDTREVV